MKIISAILITSLIGTALVAPGTYQQVLEQVTCEYEILIAENQVAQYNLERWQLIG